jgi:hypothetical protein
MCDLGNAIDRAVEGGVVAMDEHQGAAAPGCDVGAERVGERRLAFISGDVVGDEKLRRIGLLSFPAAFDRAGLVDCGNSNVDAGIAGDGRTLAAEDLVGNFRPGPGGGDEDLVFCGDRGGGRCNCRLAQQVMRLLPGGTPADQQHHSEKAKIGRSDTTQHLMVPFGRLIPACRQPC